MRFMSCIWLLTPVSVRVIFHCLYLNDGVHWYYHSRCFREWTVHQSSNPFLKMYDCVLSNLAVHEKAPCLFIANPLLYFTSLTLQLGCQALDIRLLAFVTFFFGGGYPQELIYRTKKKDSACNYTDCSPSICLLNNSSFSMRKYKSRRIFKVICFTVLLNTVHR